MTPRELPVKRILVTGAAGFIGSWLTERLLERSDVVVGFDNFDPFYDRAIKEQNLASARANPAFRMVEGDLRDRADVSALFDDGGFDAVVHLAAKAGVRPSLADPAGYYETNLIGTSNLLEAMRESSCRRLVFASSSSVYGNNRKVPFQEDDRVDTPISPYAATKKAGEELCHVYHAVHGFSILALRFFTAYGPRQRPEMAIHAFTRRLFAGEPVPVFGDGSMERDFTYIDDVVDGVVSAVDHVIGADVFDIVNLGESEPIRLSRLVAALERATGCEAVIDRREVPAGDVDRTFADVSRARNLLGYEPSVGIDEGLRRFVEWYRQASLEQSHRT
ncbi:MAG TPA: NAD-dependent epimerase/dehydratase family protein [Gemmatimonadota bacterium]|nr:NAD-dependent epimerase/dehydratase family protein [Gemmatimonadota bacterium]